MKPTIQTNMLPRSLETNSLVTLIVIYALLIWPPIEGKTEIHLFCMYLSSMSCKLNCYITGPGCSKPDKVNPGLARILISVL